MQTAGRPSWRLDSAPVLSLAIALRLLLAAQPQLLTPVLQVVHRVLTRFLLDQAGLKANEADSGAVTLIQRFGSTANLNVPLHCRVLDGVYRSGTDGEPVFVEVSSPTDEAWLTTTPDEARALRTLQAAACTCRIALARSPARRC